MLSKKQAAGFTLVELLIVIVVIGILAAVVIVAYNGVTRHAQTSSLKNDMENMDKAQRNYMTLNSAPPVSYDSNGNPNTVLAFTAGSGNSIIVQLKSTTDYCIYGYNPISDYPTPSTALIRSSDNTACTTLPDSIATNQSTVYSTVAIIGQRLEAYKNQYSYYPHVSGLTDIGLVIQPNNGNANQQQLYCRNDSNAIYLQIDTANNVAWVYQTSTHSIVQLTNPSKLSLNTMCPQYNINSTDPGYESTGIRDPNIS